MMLPEQIIINISGLFYTLIVIKLSYFVHLSVTCLSYFAHRSHLNNDLRNPCRRHYESYAYHCRNCCRRDLIDERFLCLRSSKPDWRWCNLPAPVYAKWADTYQKETGNKVNYQGIGSSGGVKQITANTVDFGASDAPLSDEKLNQEGLFQFPTVIGGVVLAVNIPD